MRKGRGNPAGKQSVLWDRSRSVRLHDTALSSKVLRLSLSSPDRRGRARRLLTIGGGKQWFRATSTLNWSVHLCVAGAEPANAREVPRPQRPRPRLAIDCGTPIASSSSGSVRVASSAVAMQATPMAIRISTVIIATVILLSSADRYNRLVFASEVLLLD